MLQSDPTKSLRTTTLTDEQPRMTPRDFCYWLQGYFELAESAPAITGSIGIALGFTPRQAQAIAAHLDLVFKVPPLLAPDSFLDTNASKEWTPLPNRIC